MTSRLLTPVPRSVAIIGASERQLAARGFVRTLLAAGFDGKIYPVHPRETSVAGVPVVRTLTEIPIPIDLGVVVLRADSCLSAARGLAARGCKTVVIFSDGFREAGTQTGQSLEDELVAWASAEDVILIGPNGGGIADVTAKVVALAGLPSTLRAGDVSVISQSGAMLSSISGYVLAEGLGIDLAISLGNASSFDVVDALRACLDRPDTRVICAYMESLGRRVTALGVVLDELQASGRTVLCLKPGRSEVAQQVIKSHTASIAGPDAMSDAVLRRHGVVRFEDPGELARGARIAGHMRPLERERGLAVISGSGGAASLIGDLALAHGVPLSPLAEATMSGLRELIPETGHVSNPLDLTGRAVAGSQQAIFRLVARDPTVDAVLMPFTTAFPDESVDRAWHREYLEELASAVEAEATPLLLVGAAGQSRTSWIDSYERRHPGVAVVQGLRQTMQALGMLTRGHYSVERTQILAIREILPASPLPLSEAAGRALLQAAGIDVVPGVEIANHALADPDSWGFGYPVVVKGVLPGVAHKARVGGVELGVCDESGLERACAEIYERCARHGTKVEGFLIQEQVVGLELLVGLVFDLNAGPTLTIGLGGTLAETTAHHATVLLPLRAQDLDDLIERSGLSRILAETTTRHRFSEFVNRFTTSFISGTLGNWATIEINPLFLVADGRIIAADVLAIPSDLPRQAV